MDVQPKFMTSPQPVLEGLRSLIMFIVSLKASKINIGVVLKVSMTLIHCIQQLAEISFVYELPTKKKLKQNPKRNPRISQEIMMQREQLKFYYSISRTTPN